MHKLISLPRWRRKVLRLYNIQSRIIFFQNTFAIYNAINNTIIDSYLGLDKLDWIKKYAQQLKERSDTGDAVTAKVWATVAASKNSNNKIQDYIGIYQDNWFGKVEVFLKENQLWFKSFRSPKLNGRMYFYKANTFAIKWEYQIWNCDALASFNLDEEGKGQSIKMKGISPNIDFSFDFQDLDLQRVKDSH